MKKPVSIKLGPDDAALVFQGGDEGFDVEAVLSPQLDTLFEGEEGANEVELPIHAALAISLSRRIVGDDAFIDEVVAWNQESAATGRKVVVLEPGQVAIVLGDVDGQVSRQLFTTPDVDKLFEEADDTDEDDEDNDGEFEIPANVGLALALMTRLEEDEGFREEVLDWYEQKTGIEGNDQTQ